MRASAVGIAFTLAWTLVARADTCATTPWAPMNGVPALTDFPAGYLYLGQYAGQLYPGSNSVPADHDAAGLAAAASIQTRDTLGNACAGPGCKIVFLAIGFSNATIEFCGGLGINGDPDDPAASGCPLPTSPTPYVQTESFIYRALTDPAVNHANVVIVDGAQGGQTFDKWDPSATSFANYDRVRDQILTPSGLSEAQVQAIWLKDGNATPAVSLATQTPGNPADAVIAERYLGNIMRTIRGRYPNVKQVFLSTRIYGGYANTSVPPKTLNPEPYAFEYGFSVKWLIESQIEQMRGNPPSADAGDLDYTAGTAPWIAWGPYLWANAMTPRSDGLTWLNSDMRGAGTNECTHPSTNGESKVALRLLDFMKTAPYTAWFLGSGPACSITASSFRVAADKQTFSWSSSVPTGPFDVSKGDLGPLRASGGFATAACRNNLSTTSTVDTTPPPPGGASWLLVRCDGATWNDGSQTGSRDTTLTACP